MSGGSARKKRAELRAAAWTCWKSLVSRWEEPGKECRSDVGGRREEVKEEEDREIEKEEEESGSPAGTVSHLLPVTSCFLNLHFLFLLQFLSNPPKKPNQIKLKKTVIDKPELLGQDVRKLVALLGPGQSLSVV